jgi:hypothetical protein
MTRLARTASFAATDMLRWEDKSRTNLPQISADQRISLKSRALGIVVFQMLTSIMQGGKQMATSITHFSKGTTVAVMGLVGLFFGTIPAARAADGVPCENGPMVKNLMALTKRPCPVQATAPHELTRREVRKLTATAESAADHLKIARYYRVEADRLDAQAAGYEEAAAGYRNGPIVKNLMAPTTPARYEFFAKGFREEAKSDRVQAVSHEQMTKDLVARHGWDRN